MTDLQRMDSRLAVPHALERWALVWGVVLVALATVFRAGNRFAPLLLLVWLALGVVVLLGWRGLNGRAGWGLVGARGWLLAGAVGAPVWLPGLQLLAGVSLTPDETWLSLLAGVPLVACGWLALALGWGAVRTLLGVWLGVGVLQAVLGLVQLPFPELTFLANPSGARALGTFGNPNGYANFLAMLLPCGVLLLASGWQGERGGAERKAGVWLVAGALLLGVAGLLASLSRAGIVTGALAVVLAVGLLASGHGRGHTRGGRWRVPLTGLAVVAGLVVLAMAVAGWDWLARFETQGMQDTARELNRASSWQAITALWPMGSGMGSFGAVFTQFVAPELGQYFINAAHNDYLELLMEGGALVVPPVLALVWLVGQRVAQLARARPAGWAQQDRWAVACGVGMLAQLLHAWVDYPWQIPANAMLGAFMLGVFLRGGAAAGQAHRPMKSGKL